MALGSWLLVFASFSGFPVLSTQLFRFSGVFGFSGFASFSGCLVFQFFLVFQFLGQGPPGVIGLDWIVDFANSI